MGDTMSAENTNADATQNAMTAEERNRETLSALLDGETSELETRRLLRDLSDGDAAQLARWQLASDLMQGHKAAPVSESFNAGLMAAIQQERHARPAWMHPVASLAVAASVAVATVVGWQYWEYSSAVDKPALVSNDNRLPRLLGADAEAVSLSIRSQAQSAALQEEQERMDAMMVRHSEFVSRHSGQGVMASARFVSQEAKKDEK